MFNLQVHNSTHLLYARVFNRRKCTCGFVRICSVFYLVLFYLVIYCIFDYYRVVCCFCLVLCNVLLFFCCVLVSLAVVTVNIFSFSFSPFFVNFHFRAVCRRLRRGTTTKSTTKTPVKSAGSALPLPSSRITWCAPWQTRCTSLSPRYKSTVRHWYCCSST